MEPSDKMKKAWDLILSSFKDKCKNTFHVDGILVGGGGFNMFSFQDRIRTTDKGAEIQRSYNCIYRFIPRGTFHWNVFLEREPKLFEIYKPNRNYMICVTIPSGQNDELHSIKVFDATSNDEVTVDPS